MNEEPDVLYHYCSTSTFFNIINYKSIRLSSLTLSNDSMEGRYITDVFVNACAREGVEGDDLKNLSTEMARISSWFGALGLCLSSDGDMLSQWRGYADEAHGVSIGFSMDALKRASGSKALGNYRAKILQVEYDEGAQEALVGPIAKEVAGYIKEGVFGGGFVEIDPGKRETLLDKYAAAISSLRPLLFKCKHKAFQEEKEWRLAVTYIADANLRDDVTEIDLSYHPRRSTLVPYVDVLLEGEDAIKQVLLGPKHATPRAIIEDFVHEKFPDAEVDLSEATYR